MKNIGRLMGVLATTAVALTQATAWADNAANIMTYPVNAAVTYDGDGGPNYPVVSTILTAPSGSIYNPGTSLDGYTNFSWSYLAQDQTGSIDMFYSSSKIPLYTPHVGDQILVQGNWSPFSGIPEIAHSATHPIGVTFGSSGNPLYSPVPVLTTIPTINVGTNGYGLSLSGLGGQLLQLNNVKISGAGVNWAHHANVTGMITDQSNNSMTMFLWASSYSTCQAIADAGGPVPTGLVDMTGFISDFYSTATSSLVSEFVPTSITAVPEPFALNLCGLGSVVALVCYRLRKKG